MVYKLYDCDRCGKHIREVSVGATLENQSKPEMLLVVRNREKARMTINQMTGIAIDVIGYGDNLRGIGPYKKILLCDQPLHSDVDTKKYKEYIDGLRRRLTPNGELIELY